MIDIQQQEEMLIAIGKVLTKKILVYAIGGTALMFRGIKNSTLDIDFVFDKKSDREEFVNALKKIGAKEFDVTLVYGLKNNAPLMLEFNNCRFDMFMNKVVSSVFSDAMKERAMQLHEFSNLIIKIADIHDILLMKSATSRIKDTEDILATIQKSVIDWDILINEAEKQIALGNQMVIFSLGTLLEKLKNEKKADIPQIVLDKLWKILKEQVKKKTRK